MKNLNYLLFIVLVLISACKKDDVIPDIPDENLEEQLKTNLNVLRDATEIYHSSIQQNPDSIAAFHALTAWLTNQEEISSGLVHNVDLIEIFFANGLKSSISIIPVGENGEHLKRGGGGANNLTEFTFNPTTTEEIKNKKVLFLIPDPDFFGYSAADLEQMENLIKSSDSEMEVDMETGPGVDLSDLNRFGDYGFIILDLHGTKNGIYLTYTDKIYFIDDAWFPEDVINYSFETENIPPDKIENGELEISMQILTYQNGSIRFQFGVLVTENYIRQLNVDLSDAVIFGNHCYSGHTADGVSKNNMAQAWRSKGLASYYGYAQDNQKSVAVDNDFCRIAELQLINGLVVDRDTSGAAHLNIDGSSPYYDSNIGYLTPEQLAVYDLSNADPPEYVYLVQYFDQNYKYPGCAEDLVDIRDNQVYKTVCIGDQVWMAENLRFDTLTNWCLNNDLTMCDSVVGRFYNWNSALVSCPQGWHLPSLAEWEILADELGGWELAGGKMKSVQGFWNAPNTGATNSSGFNALGSGKLNPPSDFSAKGFQEWFWTSDEGVSNNAIRTLLHFDNEGFSLGGPAQKTDGLLCRCVKDD